MYIPYWLFPIDYWLFPNGTLWDPTTPWRGRLRDQGPELGPVMGMGQLLLTPGPSGPGKYYYR